MNKKELTEADIRTKFITPAIAGEGGTKWNVMTQMLEERYFTNGRVTCAGRPPREGRQRRPITSRLGNPRSGSVR